MTCKSIQLSSDENTLASSKVQAINCLCSRLLRSFFSEPGELYIYCHGWHPHQLRHNPALFLRKEFGLETARIILGHRSAAITEVYAELDQQKALEAIVRVE